MARYILGIETSCDETAAAVFDIKNRTILSNVLFSQIAEHGAYGGVVPEIASRSQLEKIDGIVRKALDDANVTLNAIDIVAVTCKPGLVGSLLVGISFAKALAWAGNKKLIGIDHLEGHIFSSFLKPDGSFNTELTFPHICLSASGGHTAIYLVKNFGEYELIAATIDDAAGEAFDKVAKMMGYDYPGGATIERLASEVQFKDFYKFTRTKKTEIFFSFSGLKTAVLYRLVKMGVYDLAQGPLLAQMSHQIKQEVSSSLLVCITDIFENNIKQALRLYPDIKAVTFVGGVACNKYMRQRLEKVCQRRDKKFFAAPPQSCTDNAAMIALVASYKAEQEKFSDLTLDVFG